LGEKLFQANHKVFQHRPIPQSSAYTRLLPFHYNMLRG
jgi:hypothetical protein